MNSFIVYCRVSSNFHFSFSIILCLVQKKWYVQKIPRGGWSGFGTALIWIDPNFHENCLDWSKLFLSLSKLHPNRRCSAILPKIYTDGVGRVGDNYLVCIIQDVPKKLPFWNFSRTNPYDILGPVCQPCYILFTFYFSFICIILIYCNI